MFHINYLANLIQKNEEWIFSQILSIAKNLNHTIYSIIINYPWKQSLDNFRQLLIQSHHFFKNNIGNTSLLQIDNNIFQSIAKEEATKCFERGISSQVFLALLKSTKKIINELITSDHIDYEEKQKSAELLSLCFDYLELAYIGCFGELLNQQSSACDIVALPGSRSKQYKSIFDNLFIPIMLIDPLLKITKYNKVAKKTFPFLFSGKPRSLNGTIQFEDNDSLYSKIDEFQISDSEHLIFDTIVNYNNKKGYYQVSMQKIKNSDDVVVAFFDMTHWKQLEKNLESSKQRAENSDRMKTVFLANMSHEIRTPMNAIIGFAELLSLSNPTNAEKDEYLNLIKKSSNDLLHIIEDVIDVAKIESRQLSFIPKDVYISELFYELKSIYTDVLEKQDKLDNVKIILFIPENEKRLKVRVDPKRLKQIISNLISNAIKFTDKGKIEIGYKLSENRIIYFFVKDTGIGIPYNMQKKVFDRFVQVEEVIEKNTSGTGLGLTISRNIVQLQGGNIWLSSTPGKGSNFFFYLPYIKPVIENTVKQPLPSLPKSDISIELMGYVMLIAEDDETNFFYLRESLKRTKIKILRAKTGLEAINIVENTDQIDIILMDIKMPEVNGIEATRYIKHIRPDIPIIAQTAFAMDNDKQSCLNAGCSDYISKPLKINTLLDIIYKNIKKSESTHINHHVE